jgi:Pyruvate/2-oxoacid:ferredoxin oxidoreductase delta subunit
MTETAAEVKIGKVAVIDYSLCTHCNQCLEVCPLQVISASETFTCDKCVKYCITMDVPCSPEHYVFKYADCDGCGICITHCTVKAMYWHNLTHKQNCDL